MILTDIPVRRIGDVIETPETLQFAQDMLDLEHGELGRLIAAGYPAPVIQRQRARVHAAQAVVDVAKFVMERGGVMGWFATLDAYRKQGLPRTEAAFCEWAVNRVCDEFLVGAGTWRTDYDADARAVLLRQPVSFASVVSDLARLLNVPVPVDVERALGGDDDDEPEAA